jgi:hypothetical protein
MSLLDRFKWFRKRRTEAKQRAEQRVRAERANAALNLAVDDFLFDGRLPKSAYEEEGYKSALSDGFEDEDEPRGDR